MITLGVDGADQSASGTATDRAGNEASVTIENIDIDTAKPTITPISFSANPKRITESTTITVSASDSLSGVLGGEYCIDAEPGRATGQPPTPCAARKVITAAWQRISLSG